MKNFPLLIKSIQQKDNYTFSIAWSNGATKDYSLNALQKQCPCAKCYEAKKTSQNHVDEDVRALRIVNVGLYALKIKFTSGCSSGLYTFAMLSKFEPLS